MSKDQRLSHFHWKRSEAGVARTRDSRRSRLRGNPPSPFFHEEGHAEEQAPQNQPTPQGGGRQERSSGCPGEGKGGVPRHRPRASHTGREAYGERERWARSRLVRGERALANLA